MANLVDILLAECVPSYNKGEGAILGGIAKSLSVLGDARLSVFSANPDLDRKRYPQDTTTVDISSILGSGFRSRTTIIGRAITSLAPVARTLVPWLVGLSFERVGLRQIRKRMWKKNEFLKAIEDSDIVLFGHNGAFGLGGGPGAPLFLHHLWILLISKSVNKMVVLYGGSVWPQAKMRRIMDSVYSFILKRVDLILLRDRFSFDYVESMNLARSKVYLTADPAFALDPAPSKRIDEIMEKEGIDALPGPLIGVTVSFDVAERAYSTMTRQRSLEKHVETISVAIDTIVRLTEGYILFLPHSIGDQDNLDDRVLASIIARKCKSTSRIKIMMEDYRPEELKGLTGRLNLMIGERIHSVVNSISMNVPSIAIVLRDDYRADILKSANREIELFVADDLEASTLARVACQLLAKGSGGYRFSARIAEEMAMKNGIILRNAFVSRGTRKR